MAQPRRKGKAKQKNKSRPKVVIETTATPVTENAETEKAEETVAQTQPVKAEEKPLTPAEQKKAAKAQAKKDKEIAKEKAKKKKQEAREKAGKVSIGQRVKETGSELKKISWPTFRQTIKKTGIVIAVVLFFTVVLVAFDYLLYWLNGLLIPPAE